MYKYIYKYDFTENIQNGQQIAYIQRSHRQRGIYVHVHIFIRKHVYIYTYMSLYTNTCTHTYICIYDFLYTHTQIYKYIYVPFRRKKRESVAAGNIVGFSNIIPAFAHELLNIFHHILLSSALVLCVYIYILIRTYIYIYIHIYVHLCRSVCTLQYFNSFPDL